jgi:hypothetical protein
MSELTLKYDIRIADLEELNKRQKEEMTKQKLTSD